VRPVAQHRSTLRIVERNPDGVLVDTRYAWREIIELSEVTTGRGDK
jgi:hypothetical protein